MQEMKARLIAPLKCTHRNNISLNICRGIGPRFTTALDAVIQGDEEIKVEVERFEVYEIPKQEDGRNPGENITDEEVSTEAD